MNGIGMTSVEYFKYTCEELASLYEEKNRRYGDSFARQIEKRGFLVSLIRLEDKLARYDQLLNNPSDDGGDESIEDTLKDLANYAIMTLMEVRRVSKERGRSACTVSKL